MLSHRDVLVVDDDTATRILLETLLTRAGLIVETASDGEEAVAAIDRCDFDAIVMDLFMPRLNGTDLLQRIALEHEELLRRVIVLSAAPEAALLSARQRFPIWSAMRKPADISDFIQCVLDCMAQGACAYPLSASQ
jgi:CheY-like chemotaxis protein